MEKMNDSNRKTPSKKVPGSACKPLKKLHKKNSKKGLTK
jgi:hypothetical protein